MLFRCPVPRPAHTPLSRSLLLLAFAAALTACGEDIVRPGTAGVRALPFLARAPLVVDVDREIGADSTLLITTPEDTERIVLRPYPGQCFQSGRGPECDVVAFISLSPGTGMFFNGMAGVWHATVTLGDDPRRGLLYLPPGMGAVLRDTVAQFVSVVTMTQVRCGNRCSASGEGARLRLHAALPTSIAVGPGMSTVWQPPRTRDGVLHVLPGETVTVLSQDGDRASVTAGQEDGSPAPEPSNPWGATDARSIALRVPDTQRISLEVPFRLTNRSAGTVYVRPAFAWLERWSGREWQLAYGYGAQEWDPGPEPTLVAAGASISGTLRVTHLTTVACTPCFEIDPIPGTYRLGFALYRSVTPNGRGFDYADPLPEGTAVSNSFTVVAP